MSLLLSAALLLVGGMSTCYFGVQYEISIIPEEQRSQMDDFDWIGVDWIARGLAVSALAFALGVSGLVLWWRDYRRSSRRLIGEAR